nr:uncharacterized protein LOC107450885 [Parasteatoda tepidariorum]XP_015922311.2 uncharacterized protein LOC107450885 [Parasteatoda tepidariorum]
MCQMYAIFEEIVGPKPSHSSKSILQTHGDEDQGIDVSAVDQIGHGSRGDLTELSSQYDVSRSRSRRSSGKHQRIYGPSIYQQNPYSTLPRNNRRRATSLSSNDFDEAASICSSNPLLDTISVLTYDPPDDSDDYYDLTEPTEKTVKSSGNPEGDRDSIGYAGSSSIDSGYKSLCPTPEIPDPSLYGPDAVGQSNAFNEFYTDSNSSPQSRSTKPRIMMGTKVISRQGHISPMREPPGSRRSDSSLYDVNLDHLMYLRQSLLSAIQKCESSNSDSLFAHKERRQEVQDSSAINPVPDQCYSDTSAEKTSHPSYTKTVRFNTDVKVSTLNPTDSVSDKDKKSGRTTDVSGDQNGPKIQSKSILKDPLCANLRSQLEAGSVDCTLEEEIDTLLYGRAEFYDLENVDDFPCSYVTMIEDKYRSGKPSIAKVRKLKGDKSQSDSPKPDSSLEKKPSEEVVPPTEDTKQTTESPPEPKPAVEVPTTVLISKQAKCRFTEVARCMLEIIEDLQTKKLQPVESKEQSSVQPTCDTTTSTISASANAKVPEIQLEVLNQPQKPDNDSYMAAAEYHVYEEIDYDFVKGSVPPMDVPPPLPARPSVMFMKPDLPKYHQKRAPSPPPRKGRSQVKKNASITDGHNSEVRNRPKQRGNLYCLFSDRLVRRNISRSLEREWRSTGTSDNIEDDYGFKKEFPSI